MCVFPTFLPPVLFLLRPKPAENWLIEVRWAPGKKANGRVSPFSTIYHLSSVKSNCSLTFVNVSETEKVRLVRRGTLHTLHSWVLPLTSQKLLRLRLLLFSLLVYAGSMQSCYCCLFFAIFHSLKCPSLIPGAFLDLEDSWVTKDASVNY